MNKRIGFTLIELIVVILILGILAAVAVPRFINLASQARVAALMGLRAAILSGADLAHGLQLTAGVGSQASVTIDGVQVLMANGYPNMWATYGPAAVVRFDSSMFTTTSNHTFQVTGAPDPTHCSIDYNLGTPPAPPYIVTDTSGC